MNCLIIVNESPWGSTLPLCAWRFACAACAAGMPVEAVFFREDGVYNALGDTASDPGTPELQQAWAVLAQDQGTRLLVCSASADRRLAQAVQPPFAPAGLSVLFELALQCRRVVTF